MTDVPTLTRILLYIYTEDYDDLEDQIFPGPPKEEWSDEYESEEEDDMSSDDDDDDSVDESIPMIKPGS